MGFPYNSCGNTNLVQKYIGSAYSNVKTVAENIDDINDIADNLDKILEINITVDKLEQAVIDSEKSAEEAKASAESAAKSEANAAVSETKAKGHETNSEELYNKTKEIYEAFAEGAIYRGVWNPQETNAYPDGDGINSYWDVVLNKGTREYIFDDITWTGGDRLIYSSPDNKYYHVDNTFLDGGVESVNGKRGVVILTADDIEGLKYRSNPNLFINGCFSVNQRYGVNARNGISIGAKNDYFADRWILRGTDLVGGTIKASSHANSAGTYIRMVHEDATGSGSIEQRLDTTSWDLSLNHSDLLVNEKITVSTGIAVNARVKTGVKVQLAWRRLDTGALVGDTASSKISVIPLVYGTGYRHFFTVNVPTVPQEAGLGHYDVSLDVSLIYGSADLTGGVPDGEYSFYDTKCEWGDTATLFVPDDPAVNLAKCQYYYQRSIHFMKSFEVGETSTAFTTGGNVNWRFANIPAFTQKRANGVLRISDKTGALGKVYDFDKGESVAPSSYVLNHVSGVASLFLANGFTSDGIYNFSWEYDAEI